MSLIHPLPSTDLYPIGSIVDSYTSPGNNWLECNGQVISQNTYSELYALMDQPHPIFENWEYFDSGLGDYYGIVDGIAFANTKYVAGVDGGMAYSSDCESWTFVNLSHTNNMTKPCWNGSIWVTTQDYYTANTYFATSTDGVVWTERNFTQSAEWRNSAVWDGTYFCLVAQDDGYTQRSTDGINWTATTQLIDTYWQEVAVSSDGVIVTHAGNNLAVSIDSMTTWTYYVAADSTYGCEYISDDDIFIAVYGDISSYGISPGDDGVNWEVRELNLLQDGHQFGRQIYDTDIRKIVKLNGYYIAITWYGHWSAYSTDLRTWTKFPITYGEWYEGIYNSTTGYYYIYGVYGIALRWKEVDEYNTTTHFKLPTAQSISNWNWGTKSNRYIRVK